MRNAQGTKWVESGSAETLKAAPNFGVTLLSWLVAEYFIAVLIEVVVVLIELC